MYVVVNQILRNIGAARNVGANNINIIMYSFDEASHGLVNYLNDNSIGKLCNMRVKAYTFVILLSR